MLKLIVVLRYTIISLTDLKHACTLSIQTRPCWVSGFHHQFFLFVCFFQQPGSCYHLLKSREQQLLVSLLLKRIAWMLQFSQQWVVYLVHYNKN